MLSHLHGASCSVVADAAVCLHWQVQAGPDGYIAPPEGPGLGITINEEVLSSLLVAESGW